MAATATKQQPTMRLADLDREIADLRTQLASIDTRRAVLTEELAGLLGTQRRTEHERRELQQTHTELHTAVETAKTALARHIGKPTEDVYSTKLAEAETAALPAKEALATFDMHANTEATNTRIQQIRELLPTVEAEEQPIQAQLHEREQQREIAIAAQSKTALLRLLSAYQDLLDIIESEGPAIAILRIEAPTEWSDLLWTLALDQQQWHDVLTPAPSPDGKSQDFRPLLKELQSTVRAKLKRLQ